ncbi:MAG TPA: TetR family transcriptional regulator [Acidimicrobiales bacterium]|nr:TetR family transcriptional regulator [Acidimicrobiales bacterium]
MTAPGGTAERPVNEARAKQFTAHGQDRREEIVRAAHELFARDGYAETRMTDIAAAAGVTKGLLYWYFDSRDALIAEIVRDARRRLRDAQRAAVEGVDDPLERLYLGTAAAVRFVIANFRLYQVSEGLTPQVREVAGKSSMVHARDAAATIEEGQKLGVVRAHDTPTAIAYANAGVVNNMSANSFYKLIPGTPDEVAHAAARYVVRACAADQRMAEAIEAKHALRKPGRPRRSAPRQPSAR